MPRTTKILGFSVPPALQQEVERVAREEHRTKSELFREMFRVYQSYRKQRDQDEARWARQLIAEAQQEESEHPMTQAERLAEYQHLARYGARRAKKLGIKESDVIPLVHESRARQDA